MDYFTNNPTDIVSSNRILYTPSTFARSSLFHLQEIGSLTAQQPHVSSRSNLSSYLFFCVTHGAGTLVYNGRNFYLEEGSCVFIDCTHSYSHTTSPDHLWSLSWVHFNGATMPAIYEKYIERGGQPVFVLQEMKMVEDIHNRLMTEAGGSSYMRDMLINQYLSELLVLIMEHSWNPEEQVHYRSDILAIKDYLDQNFRERITLDELENRFYLNKYHISKTFKEQFGSNISTYILNLRITRAKQLLRFSEKTVEEIADEVGLGSAAYFSQRFKEVEGVSPTKYREQW